MRESSFTLLYLFLVLWDGVTIYGIMLFVSQARMVHTRCSLLRSYKEGLIDYQKNKIKKG